MPQRLTISCLGPCGTHSEAAARRLFPGENILLHSTISAALDAIDAGSAAFCVIPIENSIEGSINITLDTLSSNRDFCIVKELVWPIRHHLMAKEPSGPLNIIMSHPQALAQCRENIKKIYPQAKLQETVSTAEAARLAADTPGSAAIGAGEAAELYGLHILQKDLQDFSVNCTRFVSIAARPFLTAEESAEKTSIVCELPGEQPGTLYRMLKEFAKREINLVRIESRPARTALGRYIFFFDLEGSAASDSVGEALAAIKPQTLWLKILGSYPVLKA